MENSMEKPAVRFIARPFQLFDKTAQKKYLESRKTPYSKQILPPTGEAGIQHMFSI
jgi:hypothetical protein